LGKAGDPGRSAIIQRLARWLAATSQPEAPAKSAYIFDPARYTWGRR
jgi:hypothetical protein